MRDQTPTSPNTSDRKDTHIDLAMSPLAQSGISNSMDRLRLAHCAMPELDLVRLIYRRNFLAMNCQHRFS